MPGAEMQLTEESLPHKKKLRGVEGGGEDALQTSSNHNKY